MLESEALGRYRTILLIISGRRKDENGVKGEGVEELVRRTRGVKDVGLFQVEDGVQLQNLLEANPDGKFLLLVGVAVS